MENKRDSRGNSLQQKLKGVIMQNLDLSKFWFYRLSVEGWLAHFRQPTTVSSRLTFILPPKSTAIGMLLAKVGLYKRIDKNILLFKNKKLRELFDNTFIAISLKRGIVKYMDYLNYISKKDKRKPTNIEYIVNPSYEIIYFLPKDDLILGEKNKEIIINKEIFKVYLGYNECPATINLSEEINSNQINFSNRQDITTDFILPLDVVDSSSIDRSKLSELLRSSILISTPQNVKEVEDTMKEKEVLVPLRKMEFRLNNNIPVFEMKLNGNINQFLVI